MFSTADLSSELDALVRPFDRLLGPSAQRLDRRESAVGEHQCRISVLLEERDRVDAQSRARTVSPWRQRARPRLIIASPAPRLSPAASSFGIASSYAASLSAQPTLRLQPRRRASPAHERARRRRSSLRQGAAIVRLRGRDVEAHRAIAGEKEERARGAPRCPGGLSPAAVDERERLRRSGARGSRRGRPRARRAVSSTQRAAATCFSAAASEGSAGTPHRARARARTRTRPRRRWTRPGSGRTNSRRASSLRSRRTSSRARPVIAATAPAQKPARRRTRPGGAP